MNDSLLDKRAYHLLVCLLACTLVAAAARAAESAPPRKSLASLSLEELLNESVTSVSKKEMKINNAPTAISVITQEDIRRSGLNSLPELLRTVPGLEVARVNNSEWAISARGFNNQYANKLLVLVDGRSVYTPSFGGVHWNVQDTVLDDLDRIEVIRGPGATLWGANAVNGVINIITKSARDTQGGLITTTVGTEDQPSTSIRYGGTLATNLYYRAYVKYFNRDGMVDSHGKDTPDSWDAIREGLRLDWEPTPQNNLTFQGDYYNLNARGTVNDLSLTPPFAVVNNITARNHGGNVLGRWTHTFSETSELSLQSYYDGFENQDGRNKEYRDTADLQVEHRFALGGFNDVVYGAGYRFTGDRLTPAFAASLTPERRQDHISGAFLQDDITLVPERLHLTLGSKVEHNDWSGLELEPGGRLIWTPSERQSIWASISRAVRTPTRADLDSRANLSAFQLSPASPPMLVSAFGNPNVTSEKLIAYELGYRLEPARNLSFDLAAFYNSFRSVIAYSPISDGLETSPAPPHLLVNSTMAQNINSGGIYGGEFSVQWHVTDDWKITGSYSLLQGQLGPVLTSKDSNPQQQFQIRSYVNLVKNLELNSSLYFVDRIITDNRFRVPAYFRLDAGLNWHVSNSLELGVWGQNLLQSQHPEFNSDRTSVIREIRRSVLGKLTWRF